MNTDYFFRKKFTRLISQRLRELGLGKNESAILDLIEVPPDNRLGDFAFPCFSLVKNLKKSPAVIARELAEKMGNDEYFEKIEAVQGYVNGYVRREKFIRKVLESNFLVSIKKKKRRIIIEYLNANPNKPLHLGQARNICLGDCLVRVFRFLGYQVEAVDYGDDSGVNVGYNLVAHLFYQYPLASKEKFDHYCGQVYVAMREKENDSGFQLKLNEVLKKIEMGDRKAVKIQRRIAQKCLLAQLKTAWQINSYFNLINWETDILHSGIFGRVFDQLKKSPRVKKISAGKLAGCWVFDLRGIDEFSGLENQDYVLIKSNGISTYTAKDIAYAFWKLSRVQSQMKYRLLVKQPNNEMVWATDFYSGDYQKNFGNYHWAISVIDKRQELPQKIVKLALTELGVLSEEKKYQHLSYGVVYLTPKTLIDLGIKLDYDEKNRPRLPFSSRRGWIVTLDNLFELLVSKLSQEIEKRNPDKSGKWINKSAKKLATAVIRFSFLQVDKDRDLTFDLAEATNINGATGIYLVYTYVRLKNILKKSRRSNFQIDVNLINGDLEYKLTKKISSFLPVVQKTADELSPHFLSTYLLDLARLSNLYYERVPILKAKRKMKESRLGLVNLLSQVLLTGINLLGIEKVERM